MILEFTDTSRQIEECVIQNGLIHLESNHMPLVFFKNEIKQLPFAE
jgi:hypothetical protein